MAYLYRNPQSPQEEPPHFSNFSTNPLSPPRNPNRMSGGMVSNNSDVRGSLTRRFTTNALPTLSPIGQQRRQAAGEPQVVSTPFRLAGVVVQPDIQGHGHTSIPTTSMVDLIMDSEPAPWLARGHPQEAFEEIQGMSTGTIAWHKRGQSCAGAIGDGRTGLYHHDGNQSYAGPYLARNHRPHRSECDSSIQQHWLTQQLKPNGGYNRLPPVCISSFLCPEYTSH
jgi:hypothetical protein